MAIQDLSDEELLMGLTKAPVGSMPAAAPPMNDRRRVMLAQALQGGGGSTPDFYDSPAISAQGLNNAQRRNLITPEDAAVEAAGLNRQDYLLAAGFADRMMAAERILNDPRFANAGASGHLDQLAVEWLPSVIGNSVIGDDFAMFDQARRDWINAQLRRESGAAIADSEFENATQQYFPYPGDEPEELERKRQNRILSMMGMQRSAGAAYVPIAVKKAREAIAKGADPEVVRKRLEEYGIQGDMLGFGVEEDPLAPPQVLPMVKGMDDDTLLKSLK